eukprot:TRINITY_DN7120_c0_g1_i2.p1 TRINITY_DN7120_c0_g1~~TRINITY_DN7120_c0_g1_i2.p1  ORF type:complete len:257 (-),score=57.23 TRINITY_DN7120_c0_g1_i2:1135-1905(-)
MQQIIREKIEQMTGTNTLSTQFTYLVDPLDDNFNHRVDSVFRGDMLRSKASDVSDNVYPLKIYGEGNRLLQSLSMAIYGVQLYDFLLQELLLEEISQNRDYYCLLEPDESKFQQFIDKAEQGLKLSFMHMLALSNALKRPIIVYCANEYYEMFGGGESGISALFVPSRFLPDQIETTPIALITSPEMPLTYAPLVPIDSSDVVCWPTVDGAYIDKIPEGVDIQDYMKYSNIVEPNHALLDPAVLEEIVKSGLVNSK